jgi:hypothetical protein
MQVSHQLHASASQNSPQYLPNERLVGLKSRSGKNPSCEPNPVRPACSQSLYENRKYSVSLITTSPCIWKPVSNCPEFMELQNLTEANKTRGFFFTLVTCSYYVSPFRHNGMEAAPVWDAVREHGNCVPIDRPTHNACELTN